MPLDERGNNVGIVDAGARGHVLHKMYEASPQVDGLVVFPGNDLVLNMAQKPTEIFNDPKDGFKTTSVDAIVAAFQANHVSLAEVNQDNALAAGVADALRRVGIPTVGHSQNAAAIESSKVQARRWGREAGIRQPQFEVFNRAEPAISYIDLSGEDGFAIKADGLAEGKGVKIARSSEEARQAVRDLIATYPEAAAKFLVEELAQGEEFSTFFATDGEHVALLGHAQDNKREGNNDTGENTGGMGATSPTRMMTKDLEMDVVSDTEKMLQYLREQGIELSGKLYYAGMFDRVANLLRNIEWNARDGDPEIQVLADGLINRDTNKALDFVDLATAIIEKRLHKLNIGNDGLTRVAVTVASRGYPRSYKDVAGREIFGIDEIKNMSNVDLYGAGVRIDEEGKFRASGGRLVTVVGKGDDINLARERAYGAASHIFIPGEDGNQAIFRTDIGWRDVQRLREEGY